MIVVRSIYSEVASAEEASRIALLACKEIFHAVPEVRLRVEKSSYASETLGKFHVKGHWMVSVSILTGEEELASTGVLRMFVERNNGEIFRVGSDLDIEKIGSVIFGEEKVPDAE